MSQNNLSLIHLADTFKLAEVSKNISKAAKGRSSSTLTVSSGLCLPGRTRKKTSNPIVPPDGRKRQMRIWRKLRTALLITIYKQQGLTKL